MKFLLSIHHSFQKAKRQILARIFTRLHDGFMSNEELAVFSDYHQ